MSACDSDCRVDRELTGTFSPLDGTFTSDFAVISQKEIDDCTAAYAGGGVEGCVKYFKEKQEEWKSIPLNIAVIGNSGVGKSTFINAIRDMTADDDGAAETDAVETTCDLKSYPHPNNELLKLWDLPGVGTDNFPRHSYLETIKVDQYDFFLLMIADRFRENDTWLRQEITGIKKGFYFVRSKVGQDVTNDKAAHPRTHNEVKVLQKIRDNIAEKLAKSNDQDAKAFLVDSYCKNKFDFNELEENLIIDFPRLKRSAMILSLGAFSEKMIKMKANELRSGIWRSAALSAVVAAVPVPGLSFGFDALTAITMARFYYQQLGLDDKTLERHAKLTDTDPEVLKSIVKKRFGPEFFTAQGLKMLLLGISGGALVVAEAAAEEIIRFIPLIGCILSAPLSYGGTHLMLKLIIDQMEPVALEVLRYTAEHSDDSPSTPNCDDDGQD